MFFQGSDSTQAVESFFRVLKLYQTQQFGSRLPSLTELIPAITKAIDQQFGTRQRLVENKRIKFHHSDKRMDDALEEASWDLNPTGMKIFYDKINMFEMRREFMEVQEDGRTKETYTSGEKLYEVDGFKCTCSTFAQYFYCRHMVFFRVMKNLTINDKQAFNPYLQKSSKRMESQPNRITTDSEDLSPPSPGLDMIMEHARNQKKPRTQAKKYNTAFDVGKELAEIISVYEEETFENYLECSKNFVKMLRKGLPGNVSKYLNNPENFDIYPKSEVNSGENVTLPDTTETGYDCEPENDDTNIQEECPNNVENIQDCQSVFIDQDDTVPDLPYRNTGFREIPAIHKKEFTPNSVIKTIKATRGCGYGAVV